MRVLPLLLLLLITSLTSAQNLTGIIKDEFSGKYLSGVSIETSSERTYSDKSGRFILSNINFGDTITFFSIGYRTLNYIVNNPNNDELHISMEANTIVLDEVKVHAFRNYKADSLRFRNDFAKAFNYKKPSFKDIFISKNHISNTPEPYYQANNSTSSLISVDLLSLVSLLGKNKAPLSKLQSKLVKEEEEKYIDKTFSTSIIQDLTGLKGDSLQTFIQLYRPAVETVKEMSDYETIMYIKNSYDEYVSKKN